MNGNLKLAVQSKGRLTEKSLELLKHCGLDIEDYSERLFIPARNFPVDILFLRDDDIPEYVQDGVADLGIVGSNVLDERDLRIERLLPLDFGFCSLSIAVPEQGSYKSIDDLRGKRIATSYPETLKRFLRRKGVSAETVLLKGCIEIAPALKVADAICDLVATGSTLRTNRLNVIETVANCQATLIGKKSTT